MPLQPQSVAIPITAGLDTKTHDHVLEPGRATVLQNAVFTKDGVLQKRRGFTSLSRTILDDTTGIRAAKGAAVFKDELVLFTGESLYSYSPTLSTWVDRGTAVSTIVDEKEVVHNSYSQAYPDFVVANNIAVAAWEDTRGGVYASAWDYQNEAYFFKDLLIDALADKPRLVACGDDILIAYGLSGGQLWYKRIRTGDPATVGAAVNFVSSATAASPNYAFWCNQDTGRIYYAYDDGGVGSSTRVGYMMSSDDYSSFTTSAVYAAGDGPVNGIDIHSLGADIWVAWSDNTLVRGLALTQELAAAGFDATLSATANIETVSVIAGTGSLNCTVYMSGNSGSANIAVQKHTISGGVVAAIAYVKRGVTLDGRAFSYGNKHYMCALFAFPLQATYFLLDENGDVVGKAIQSTSGDVRTISLSSFVEVTPGVFATINQRKVKLDTDNGVTTARTGLSVVEWDFTKIQNFSALEAGDNLLILGSVLHMYDGDSIVEHGFNVFPENCAATNGGAGLVDIGTHGYAFVYEWTDKQGNTHRSCPLYKTLVISGAAATVNLQFLTLQLTRKQDVRLVVYRTTANGSRYYRLTSPTTPVLNTSAAMVVNIVDNAADSSITSNEVLYSDAAVLEHIAPPSAYAICTYRGRTILADKSTVYYSKITFPGEPVAFNDSAYIPVDAGIGDITAVMTQGDKLLIFRSGSIFETYGDGPTDTGVGADYPDPRVIALDVGAESQNAVVATPIGTMFKGSKGIYVVTSEGAKYIGAGVEEFNDKTVVSAKLVPNTTQVRFVCSDGDALVYDYMASKWATFTMYSAEAAVLWQNQFCLVKSDGRVLVEDDSYQHNGSFYAMKYTSGWISFNGLLNFSRVWRMMCLGEFKNNHKLRVSFAYDHLPMFTETAIIDVASIMALTTYGADSPYGSGTPYGGGWPLDKFNIHLGRQKCSSIMFSIEDIQAGASIGESYNLTGVVFEIGAKKGLDKLQADRKTGTS